MTATNFNSNLGSPFNKIEEIGTDVSYEFRKLSTSVSNVIKIVSNENYYNNARSAYDPYSYSGFVDNYELTTAPYIVKQADVTGKVVFTGLLLRYVPSDNKQTIFIKSLDGFFDYIYECQFRGIDLGIAIEQVNHAMNAPLLLFVYVKHELNAGTQPDARQNGILLNTFAKGFGGRVNFDNLRNLPET